MWKAFSRSVCEVVERRVGFTAFRSDVSNRNTSDASARSKVCSHDQISNIIPQLKTYCALQHLKASRYKGTSHEQSKEQQQQKNRNHTRWNDPPITVSACLGAMGWSTALVLGWYLSHPLGRRIFGDTHLQEIRLSSQPQYFHLGGIVHAQSPIQPLGIRPLTYSSSIEDGTSNAGSFRSSLTSSSGDDEELFTHRRGPFTPEEALDEVSRVFEAASRALSGDVENKLGTVCMSKGQHSEAMKHFRRASHHEHAVGAYNMGQCYELGLGTARNLKKAAKWYKISSDRGHPIAMYNLAVFCANGWGGLIQDPYRARKLLILAANLGLKEAKDALTSIDKDLYDSDSNSKDFVRIRDSTEEFLELIGATAKSEVGSLSNVQHSQTYLSHLDWLDLSSSLSASVTNDQLNWLDLSSSSSVSSPTSEDVFSTVDSQLAALCTDNDWPLSSNCSGKVMKVGHKNRYKAYYVIDSTASNSSGDSVDEAANYRMYGEEVNNEV